MDIEMENENNIISDYEDEHYDLEKIKSRYAPTLTHNEFMWVYGKWNDNKKGLDFIKYLQVWQELNSVEIPSVWI